MNKQAFLVGYMGKEGQDPVASKVNPIGQALTNEMQQTYTPMAGLGTPAADWIKKTGWPKLKNYFGAYKNLKKPDVDMSTHPLVQKGLSGTPKTPVITAPNKKQYFHMKERNKIIPII